MKRWSSRTELILGKENYSKLKDSNILVVGLGGVGAYAAENLCRSGIGRMTIVDADKIDVTNINRQLPATHKTIGKSKVNVLTERFKSINSECVVTGIEEFIKDEKTSELLNSDKFDYIIDAIDTLSPKVNFIETAYNLDNKIVSSMGAGNKLDPTQVKIADISKSYNCGLARALRKRLHRKGIRKGIKVVFSPEEGFGEVLIEENQNNKLSVIGTISYMPAVFGCFCASVVIRDIISL